MCQLVRHCIFGLGLSRSASSTPRLGTWLNIGGDVQARHCSAISRCDCVDNYIFLQPAI